MSRDMLARVCYGLPEDERRVLDAGVDEHLVRPAAIERLLEPLARRTAGSPRRAA